MSDSAASPATKKAKLSNNRESDTDNCDEETMTALGHGRPKTGLAYRMKQMSNSTGETEDHKPMVLTLQETCRNIIVSNLERYPPESILVLDEQEWNLLLERRHLKTTPKQGSGGLDGKGRIAPALSDKFLHAVEEACPDVRESKVADQLIWKDCVNYSYQKGGLTRPRCLEYPWPVLLERIQSAVTALMSASSSSSEGDLERPLKLLEQSPMNVSLMVATGVGKDIKKALKKQPAESPFRARMETLLQSWKKLAQSEGVQVQVSSTASSSASSPSKKKDAPPSTAAVVDDPKDWEKAETCQNWRDLFAALKEREETRRSKQGLRMRQARAALNTNRPKVVKVRPARNPHYDKILGVTTDSSNSPGNTKLSQLRKEAAVVACRQNRGEQGNAAAMARLQPASSGSSMFARAVAGAAGQKQKGGGGGKRRMTGQSTMMQMPGKRAAPVRGKYAPPSARK